MHLGKVPGYLLFLITTLLIIILVWSGGGYGNDNQSLAKIHRSINNQKKKLIHQRKAYKILTLELQQQEMAIAALLTSIEQTTANLHKLNGDIADLSKQIEQLTAERRKQQQLLGAQLASAFKLGPKSGLEFIFNNDDSQRNGRIIVYFNYLNRVRAKVIRQLEITQKVLTAKQLSLEKRQRAQQRLQLEQQKEQTKLKQNCDKRWQTVVELNLSIKQGQQALTQLYDNEAKLQHSLNQATQKLKAIVGREVNIANQIRSWQKNFNYKPTLAEKALMSRVSGIGKPQNRLDWPVVGRVVHHFGEPIQEQLFWKGLVIGSPEGQEIRAIADGRVILADWLQGYGFMIVIDHGQGDMSLYGYNQRLLVNVKENVKKGQPVALVGNSGGQRRSGLYFEIRRDGQALNPRGWLK